jgi:dihydroneopterin aldolase
MPDHIDIHGLEIRTRIGVPDQERSRPQKLLVDLEMEIASVRAAARNDDLKRTVDYYAVAQAIKQLAAARPRRLIETLAEEIAALVLEKFAVRAVQIRIRKFILRDTEHVAVRIQRKKSGKA